MNFKIYSLLLSCHLYCAILPTSTISIVKDSKCAFKHTVNLTNHHKYDNGSFLYQERVIPSDIVTLYDYEVLWGKKKTVPLHVRGCICDRYPCIRLCCEKDEYFDKITNNCEKLKKDIQMSWELRIEKFSGKFKMANILNLFVIEIGLSCLESMALKEIKDNTILFQTGFLQTPYNRFESNEFCYSPYLTNNSIYTLKPFTCLINENKFSQGMFTLMKFLTTSKILTNIKLQGFISSLFLILTTVLYYFLKELRENLSGKLYFCYLYMITMSNIIFALLNLTNFLWSRIWIIIIGFTGIVLHIIAILWLSVFCYDIWENCHPKKNSRQLSIYCIVVGSITCLASGFVIFKKLSKSNLLDSGGIFDHILWWNNQRWFALQIILPSVFIILFNCIRLIHLAVVIVMERDSGGIYKKQFFKNNAIICLRLFAILVIPWIFKIFIPATADAVLGSIIFLSSVMRIEIWILLKKKIYKNGRIPKEGIITTEIVEE